MNVKKCDLKGHLGEERTNDKINILNILPIIHTESAFPILFMDEHIRLYHNAFLKKNQLYSIL